HFVYLTCSYPGVYTSDHFLDVKRLRLEPHFADYMGEAFKPLGVYLNFFQSTLPAGSERSFKVKLVNDHADSLEGELMLALVDPTNKEVGRVVQCFQVSQLGDATFDLNLRIPSAKGRHVLRAVATPEGRGARLGPTQSRRWVSLE